MKNIKISLLAVTVLLASCGNKEELVSGIVKKNMDTSVKPGDNFDRFVNGTWTKNTKIPADKASFGAFDMLYDKSQKDVKAIIEEASKGSFTEGSDEQKIGDYYSSFTNRKNRDAKGVTPIQSELKAIDVDSYKIVGYWYFDKRQGELKYRLLGISPVIIDVFSKFFILLFLSFFSIGR